MAVVLSATSSLAATNGFFVSSTLDATQPSSTSVYSATTGQLATRLFRNGATNASCAASVAFPNTTGTGPYRYDRYRFTARVSGCISISVNHTATGQVHVSLYSSFDPTNLQSGFLADSGNSAITLAPTTLSVSVVAGQSYDVVVNEAVSGVETTAYELTVDDRTHFTLADTLDAVAPTRVVPVQAVSTGQIPGARLNRNSIPSVCGTAKPFPGTLGAGPYRYDAYTFTAVQTGCMHFTVADPAGTGSALVSLYSTFDPNNVATGYLADSGFSAASADPVSAGFAVVAGQVYTVVVSESTASVDTTAYTFTAASADASSGVAITIPSQGAGSPSPSVIDVSGLQGTVTGVALSLNGLTHTVPDDLDVLLVAPDGRQMVVMSDVGGSGSVAGIDVALSDGASSGLPDGSTLTSGVFRPTSVGDNDTFTAGTPPPPLDCTPAGECNHAAPAGTATLASVFGGAQPNGAWKLYVVDDAVIDSGTIDGWRLVLTTTVPVMAVPTADQFTVTTRSFVVAAPGVIANDFTGGGAVTAALVTGTSHGTVTLAASGGFTYTPVTDYYGTDSFTYLLNGPAGATAPVTVTLAVVPSPPTAVSDAYSTSMGTALSVAAPGVLGNDIANGTPVTSATVITPPASGTLSLNANGGFTYQPAPGFFGAATFTYVANSGAGPSAVTTVTLLVLPVQPPDNLRVADMQGDTVTFRWEAPVVGPAVSGYVLEAGVSPGGVIASLPLGSAPMLTLAGVPTGSFFVRLRSRGAGGPSVPSNEIRIFVNTPTAPSAPDHVAGTVNGSTVELSWRNTYAGGEPSSLVLDVSGTLVGSIPLSRTELFTFPAVPPGSFTFQVREVNAAGASGPSTPVTLSFPSGCSGAPALPTHFVGFSSPGNLLTLAWDPPASGSATTTYLLDVTGAYVGMVPLAGQGLSLPVPSGSYTFRLAAANSCGAGTFTAPITVVVP